MKPIHYLVLLSTICLHGQRISKYPPSYCKGQIVAHKYYSLQYSESDEQALWTAYTLSPEFLMANAKRSNRFKADKSVITGSASLQDYKNSGYDRGHLAPAGSMTYDKTAMDESFFMSNMSPQDPGFNRGIWKKLESKIRDWTVKSDSLYVVTGPILSNATQKIGPNQVTVPKAFYKVVLRYEGRHTTAIAFILPNEKSNQDLSSFATSIDAVEKETGIDFNEPLPNRLEKKLERNTNLKEWAF